MVDSFRLRRGMDGEFGEFFRLRFEVDIFIDPSAALRTFASLQHARMIKNRGCFGSIYGCLGPYFVVFYGFL